jgi:superfamily II DNA or RNA helicase
MIEFKLDKNKIKVVTSNLDEIREYFSVNDDTARFRFKGRARFIVSPRIYCITPTGLFEPGMFYDVLTYIKMQYPNEDIIVDNDISSLVKPVLKDVKLYNNLKYELRDYQQEACKNAIAFGRGILKMGTGAGKTLTICSLLMSLYLQKKEKKESFKCLLIVPDLGLVSQTYTDFEQYNALFKFTKWTGKNKPDLTANVIIANLGILQSRFLENDWLKEVDALVIDECHKVKKSNKISKMVHQIKTSHKFGLTGTLPDNKPDEWNIKGKIGKVIYDKDSYELRLEKYLTTVNVSIIDLKYNDKPLYVSGTNNFKNELDFIYTNEFRNNLIKGMCSKFDNNSLILVNHLAHGDALYNKLSECENKQVFFVKGEVEVETRDQIKKIMETNNNVICIAMSSIFSTGINIKNIHMIMFASGGKSFIRTIQSIGRGLRLHDNKNKLVIIDLADHLKYGERHSLKRKEIYNQEKINYKITEIVEK